MSILVAGGTVVSSTGTCPQDVLIDGERIVALGVPGQFPTEGHERVIDATGKYVIPGGVDAHVHLELPFGDTFSTDTYETGTRAAAWGGVTTVMDMPVQRKGEHVMETLAAWHAKAEGECAVDYAFHQIVGDVTPESLAAMRTLVEHEGITSFKLFTAYPGVYYVNDGELLEAMQTTRDLGAVMLLHAENGPAIDLLVRQAVARGDTDPKYHAATRPSLLEGEAANRAIVLSQVAGNAPLYIVHMSSAHALEAVAAARHEGRNIFAETCPQYLWLTVEDTLERAGFEGAKWVCTPPIRSPHDPTLRSVTGHGHQADLWKGLRMNEIATVATDHCPFCFKEQKEAGIGNFAKIPNGIGGVEHRLELIYQGVVAGEISLERWVETCCTTPARMFGMYPKKGAITPGSDADVVLWDPASTTRIGVGSKHHTNSDYSAYEGFEVAGKVHAVLSRGTVIVEGNHYVGRKGHGRYVPRGLSQYLV